MADALRKFGDEAMDMDGLHYRFAAYSTVDFLVSFSA
jgi:hypothetical protein